MLHLVGRIFSGAPAAETLARFKALALDPTRSLRVYLSQGLDFTTSSIEGYEVPPSGVIDGSTALNNGAATAVVAASTPIIACTIYNPLTNANPFNVGAATVTAARGVQVPVGGAYTPPAGIDDLNKLYCFVAAANQTVEYIAFTR